MAVAGFVLQGSVANSPLSRGWIMMPHAKSVQPGADKRTPARQLACIHEGGCLWLRGMSLTLHLRLGGNYVSRAGTTYLGLASGSHQSFRLGFPSTWNTHLSHVMISKATGRDYADPTQCALYTLKIPFCLHSGFQTQSLSWFAFVFSTHVFKLPICVI